MNMNKKSFFLGAVAGIVMTVIVVLVIGLINKEKEGEEDPIEYLETPVSYENKSKTSFKVFQVLGDAALAHELSDDLGDEQFFYGKVVLILGENFYSDQVVNVKNPQRVGTFSYTSKEGHPMTVPVVAEKRK